MINRIVSRYINAVSDEKVQFLKKKYNLSDRDTNLIVACDPTDKGLYLDWVIRQYKKGSLRLPEDTPTVATALKTFDSIKNKRFFESSKDINSYKIPADLYVELRKYEGQENITSEESKRLTEAGPGASLFIDNPKYRWYRLANAQAACAMGTSTDWCTRHKETADHYYRMGPLFVLYAGGKALAQVHLPSHQFMDKNDRPIAQLLGETRITITDTHFAEPLKDLLSKIEHTYIVGTGEELADMSDAQMAEMFLNLYPGLQEALENSKNPTIQDIRGKLYKWGELSKKQVKLVFWLYSQEKEATKPVEPVMEGQKVPVVEGKREISGTILSAKGKQGDYGFNIKLLIETTQGEKLYGNITPKNMRELEAYLGCGDLLDCPGLKGTKVSFMATVAKSSQDEFFGFWQRMTKFKIL
jgi:hypothetical protein